MSNGTVSEAPGGRRGRWYQVGLVALFGLAVVAWWAMPLLRPRGAYAGHYRFFDIEIGVVGAVASLAMLAVTVCPARWRRALTLRLVTVLGAMLIAEAVTDLAYVVWSVRVANFWYARNHYSYRYNVPDPELIWRHRPRIAWDGRKTNECQFVRFQTDENGFRNPPGVRQADLVFLGDSVTEAAEVADRATFVRKAGGALGLSAVNLGVFSYGPQQELAVLRRYGLAYKPRAVVWQLTEWNDLDDAESFAHPDRRPRLGWRDLYERFSPAVRLVELAFPVRRKYLVDFQRSDGAVDRRAVWPYFDNAAHRRLGLEQTRHTIAAAHALCRERGIAFVVLFVPSHLRVLAPYVRPRTPLECERYRPACGLDHPGDASHELAEFCRRIDCPMIDLCPPLRRLAASDNRHVYVKSDTHLDVDGHEEAAREVVDWLRSRDGLALGVPRDPETTAARDSGAASRR
jgi:hypothetical protein